MGKFPWVCPKWAWLTSDLLCSLQDECAISGAAGARCSCSGAASGGEQVRLHEASVWQIQLRQGEALQAACHIDNTSSSSSSANNNNNVDDVDNDNDDGGSVALIRGVHHQHLAQDQNCNGVSGCQHRVNKQQQGNLHEQQHQLHFLSFHLLLHHHAEHSSEQFNSSCRCGIRHGARQQQQCKQYNHHHRQQHNAIQLGQHTAIATDACNNNNNNSCSNWGRGQSARALHLRCLPVLADTQRTAREATDPQRDGPYVSLQCHRTQAMPDQVPGGGECVQPAVRNSLPNSRALSLSRLSSTFPTRRTLSAPHWATIATRNVRICSSRIATTSGWTRNCRRVASTAARRARPIAAPCWVERGAGPDGDDVSKTE